MGHMSKRGDYTWAFLLMPSGQQFIRSDPLWKFHGEILAVP